MTGLNNFLSFLQNNYASIVAIIIIILSIYMKVKSFMIQEKSVQAEQIKECKEHVLECAADIVKVLIADAEAKYGDNTGVIKKSYVQKELLKLLPSLSAYLENGDIQPGVISGMIDDIVVMTDSVNETYLKNLTGEKTKKD